MTISLSLRNYSLNITLYEGVKTIVYRGNDNVKKRPVIIKILKSSHPEPKAIAELQHEHQISQSLKLASIVQPYSLEFHENRPYLVLEDFGGESLKNYLDGHPLDIGRFLHIALQLTQALGDLHLNRLIHKDIKPPNIIINPQTEEVKITDFGIASPFSRDNQNLNQLEGTLAYISPEQTGRMNRVVDYRTDFYSLGVTFYEMLTGQLPFVAEDAMALIHSHIARNPRSLTQINPKIPSALANIIIKLMAKTAEARYQSARGLWHDLEKCRQQWTTTQTIQPFPLGEKDIADQFQIPQKLYGRETAVQQLLDIFATVTLGQTELVVVTGHAGIGKSSVVREIYKPITKQRGYVATGKFVELQRNTPYAAFIQALTDLIRHLLTQSQEKIEAWRDQIMQTIQPNGQLLTDLIPELTFIIGEQEPVPTLPPAESQNRFLHVFQQFIQLFAQANHPLVLFLDDIQWADVASLQLLKTMVTNPTSQHLLFIGAYRDNEIKDGDILSLNLRDIENAGKTIYTIHLAALTSTDITHLLADTLHCTPEQTTALAELIADKTAGNPFFINELLKSLYTDQKLTFDHDTDQWVWDIQQIRRLNLTDNVVNLVINKLKQLPPDTQEILTLAACLGNRFHLKELADLSQKSEQETALTLREALLENFIWSHDNNYQLAEIDITGLNDELNITYQFAHDRVHQAIYERLTDEKKQQLHWHIGHFLQATLSPAEQDKQLFNITDHLNLGIPTELSLAQTEQLLALNQNAGQKSKNAAAYQAALNYYQRGLALLSPQSWQNNYEHTFQMHIDTAESAYLSLDFATMENLLDVALQHAQTSVDKARVYEIQILAHISRNQKLETTTLALKALTELGIKVPANPSRIHVGLELIKTRFALRGKDVHDLANRPIMTDPRALTAVRIMSSAISAAMYSNRNLYVFFVTWRIRLALKYGNIPLIATAYNGYAVILCGILNDIEAGYQLSKVAQQMVDILNAPQWKPRIYSAFYGIIYHWKKPLRDAFPHLNQVIQHGIEVGDFEFASHGIVADMTMTQMLDLSLPEFQRNLQQYHTTLTSIKQDFARYVNEQIQQFNINLTSPSTTPTKLKGKVFDEDVMIPRLTQLNDKANLFFIYKNKLALCLLFVDYLQAVQHAEETRKYLTAVTGTIIVPTFYLYESLALLLAYPQITKQKQKETRQRVQKTLKKMKIWAKHGPENNLCRYYLLQAEYERVLGEPNKAIDLYDKAIEQASQHRYSLYAGLANELAGRFYLETGKPKFAKIYLKDAHYTYYQWGAYAKVQALEEEFPFLQPKSSTLSKIDSEGSTAFTLTTVDTTITSGNNSFDLNTLLKATQVIFSEIDLDKLLQKLMKLMIENAGAQRGVLFLNQDNVLVLKATTTLKKETIVLSDPKLLSDSSNVPITPIQYVTRTKEPIVLDNAHQKGLFTGDLYIVSHQPKSILIAPLVNQNALVGVLYLENNLTASVFTVERVRTIQVLGTQAAISITNAQALATQAEQERLRLEKEFLEIKNRELAKLNADKDRFFSIISHDLRAPFNSLLGMSQLLMIDIGVASDEENLELAERIYESGKNTLNLLDNLLQWSRLQTGRMVCKPKAIFIHKIANDVLNVLSSTAENKGINLHNICNENLQAYADSFMIETVIRNLVSNALKFTNIGGEVIISNNKTTEFVEISIQDTGVGMSSEDMDKLFRIDTHHSTRGTADEQGTGLGLIMCQELIKQNKGLIWVESKLGKGTTFKFTVPFISNI